MKLVPAIGVFSLFALLAASATEAVAADTPLASEPEAAATESLMWSPPAGCTTGRNLSGYNAGYSGGTSITNAAWLRILQDPDRYEELKTGVTNGLLAAAPGGVVSVYVLCRFAGTHDGAMDRLIQLQNEVIQICLADGFYWGKTQGLLYCKLSIDFAGLADLGAYLRPPVGLCGNFFESWCDYNFDQTTAGYAGCGTYLSGTFATVVANYRDRQCKY